MKIYTKTGDDGTTGLYGGSRVSKIDLRIEVIGAVDELNARLGLARSYLQGSPLAEEVSQIQNLLFDIGAELATPEDNPRSEASVDDRDVARIEQSIDAQSRVLPELKNFILPGGSIAAGQLHVARTACRTAERRTIEFSAKNPVRPELIRFLNRLSDWLFIAARSANRDSGVDDVKWTRSEKV